MFPLAHDESAADTEAEGLNTKTAAGWAMIFAVVGVLFLTFTLGRGQGIARGFVAALGFISLVAAAEMFVHPLARSYAELHADSPMAGGLGLAL